MPAGRSLPLRPAGTPCTPDREAHVLRWDPSPFILLNPAFSLQDASAAPLILLAQTRQADRDILSAADADQGQVVAPGSLESQPVRG